MKPEPSLTVISLGGGVQSSVMALMANEGAFDRIPDCAIFADTRWEPPSIYEHLAWLKDRLSFPLYVVDNGRSLREDVKALTNHSGLTQTYVDIPRLPQGTRRGGRRHRQDASAPTNYKLSDRHPPQLIAAGAHAMFFAATPISSAVGSRPSSGTVSVFVWE